MNKRDGPTRQNIIWLPILLTFIWILIFDHKYRNGIWLNIFSLVRLGINYFQFGAVRRGLVGSPIYISGVTLTEGAFLLHWISFAAFITLAYVMLRRMTVPAVTFLLPFAIILGALLLFWSADIGRTDMLIAAILVIAALAAIEGRIATASVCIAVGLMIHEVAAVYGLPLLAAILLDEGRYRDAKLRSAATATAIIIASLAAYAVLPLFPHSDPQTIAATIKSEVPSESYSSDLIDEAMYYLVTGTRSVRMTQCRIQHNIHYFIYPFIAMFMISLAILSMSGAGRLKWVPPVIASVPPLLFLWITALDMTRWTTLSLFNVWAVCAVQNCATIEVKPRWAWSRVACAVAVLLFLYPGVAPMGRTVIFPSPLIEKFVEKVLGPLNIKTIDYCDPTWRSVLTGRSD